MTCNQECNQGRNCNCDRTTDRATVVITVLMIICMLSLCYGVYKLLHVDAGYPCAIEVQFKDSKATYIGRTV